MNAKAPTEAEAIATRTEDTAGLGLLQWRSSPHKRKANLLATRLADLTVADLLRILEDLGMGQRLAERGLL